MAPSLAVDQTANSSSRNNRSYTATGTVSTLGGSAILLPFPRVHFWGAIGGGMPIVRGIGRHPSMPSA